STANALLFRIILYARFSFDLYRHDAICVLLKGKCVCHCDNGGMPDCDFSDAVFCQQHKKSRDCETTENGKYLNFEQ
ncbi:MAG: hypothetical protein NC427_03540, partial [Ruminococcus flavefaciens]|nr:hypothetical protein [Ruminococcus flavefaciens]